MKKDKKGKTPVIDTIKLGATVVALGVALGVNMDAAYGVTGSGEQPNNGAAAQGAVNESGQHKLDTTKRKLDSSQDKWKAGQSNSFGVNSSQDKHGKAGLNNTGVSQQKKGAVQSKSIIIEGSSTQIKGESTQQKLNQGGEKGVVIQGGDKGSVR